jgi:hypothetical protein
MGWLGCSFQELPRFHAQIPNEFLKTGRKTTHGQGRPWPCVVFLRDEGPVRTWNLIKNAENTNGPLRQYLPKGEDLRGYSQDELDDIAASLNARPRKSLGWKAPAELFLPVGAFDFVKHWSSKINPVALGA